MTGNEIVLSLACALAEERARHEQTRQTLSRELEAARRSAETIRAAAQSDRVKLERERCDLISEITAALEDDVGIVEKLSRVRATIAHYDPDA